MPASPRYALAATCILALAACGAQPQESDRDAPLQTQAQPTASQRPAASTQSGAHALDLRIGDTRHSLRSDSGSVWRNPVPGAAGVESLTIEVLNSENTVYAKADLFVSAGAPIEGEYRLGLLGSSGISNTPGRGQVFTAIEESDDRHLRVSGDGQLRLSREGKTLVARFEYTRSAFNGELLDAAVSGELRVADAP